MSPCDKSAQIALNIYGNQNTENKGFREDLNTYCEILWSLPGKNTKPTRNSLHVGAAREMRMKMREHEPGEHPASRLRTPGPRLIAVMTVSGCVEWNRPTNADSLPKITRDSGGAPACASREQTPLLRLDWCPPPIWKSPLDHLYGWRLFCVSGKKKKNLILLPSLKEEALFRDLFRQLGFKVCQTNWRIHLGKHLKCLTNLWAEMTLDDFFYP